VTGAAVLDDPRSHVVWPRRVTRDECRCSVGRVPVPLSYRCTDSGTYAAQFPPWYRSWNMRGGPTSRRRGRR